MKSELCIIDLLRRIVLNSEKYLFLKKLEQVFGKKGSIVGGFFCKF